MNKNRSMHKTVSPLMVLCGLISLFTACSTSPNEATHQGNLFIIGGGQRSPALIQQLVETAALGHEDYIVVLPMASTEPDTAFHYIATQLRETCDNPIYMLNFSDASVNDATMVDSLRNARLVYITGGDQNRFMQVVKQTPVYTAIHEAYHHGATIAGTSAGAAIMSKLMITGQQLLGDTTYKETFDKLWTDNIEFQEGMGLLETVIIDQHFIKRSRYNRLLSALASHPSYTCIGIDEGTALVVKPDRMAVVGASQIVVISKPQDLQDRGNKLITLKDLHFAIYADGDELTIK